jgi:preprotein translocase subunit SecF
MQRGGIAAAAVPLAIIAALLYIPGFYMTDSLLYRNRMRRRARESVQQRESPD